MSKDLALVGIGKHLVPTVLLAILVSCGKPEAEPVPTAPSLPKAAPASQARAESAAILHASQAGKFLFLLFYDREDDELRRARAVIAATVPSLQDKAEHAEVDRNSPDEEGVVERFGVQRAPTPLVIVLAPNGAVTGGFVGDGISEAQLRAALVSRAQQDCLKLVQGRKVAILCVQNGSTRLNDVAMKGVHEFIADPQFHDTAELVIVDPADPAEEEFLTQLRVDTKVGDAVTVLLAPPGTVAGMFRGETKKDAFVTALQACGSGG